MRDYKNDFASFGDQIWLNAASEGPLPLIAAQHLEKAVEWKSKPYLLDMEKFVSAQKGLKESIGQLISVPYRDVILGNSASYGLHILANGIPWEKGDEIIVMHNDFPADILPWLALEQKGVVVHQVIPAGQVIESDELLENINERTRLVCIPSVHTFSGVKLDVERMAEIGKEREIIFVLNITQSVGTIPMDLSKIPVDAVVAAGYKWLCGPYGVGFCWIKPALRDQLQLNRAYWSSALSEEDLKSEDVLTLKNQMSARKYDIFGTANFFNYVPFKAAIDYWLEIGLDNVRITHDQLIDAFISNIDEKKYEFISPKKGSRRSSLVFITHRDKSKNKKIFDDLKTSGIHSAFWKGNIRFTPHVYNAVDELNKTADALNRMG